MCAEATITVELPSGLFVLAVCYKPKTNNLGRVQRRIVEYLATAPAGFGGPIVRKDGQLFDHGRPYGVTVAEITRQVYGTDTPTASQTRAVQRAVRQLEERGEVHCWRGVLRHERRYATSMGFDGLVPVSALFVAARWDCEHLREQERRRERAKTEYEAQRTAELSSGERVAALQDAIGGGT